METRSSSISALSQFVAGVACAPDAARHAAARCLLDLLTASVVGLASAGGQAARRAAPSAWGGGTSWCWFGGPRLSVAGATFANAAIASMLDLDDGHRAAAGHPGAAIIPAVLAELDRAPAPDERVLTAIALGYEVAVRIAASRDFSRLDTTATGRWCGQGVAAAIGWLRGLPAERIAQAIGIAASSAPNLNVTGFRTEAGHVKEGIPFAASAGATAAELAEAGFTGSLLALDDARFHDADAIMRGLGEGCLDESWLIETTYFKPYSCCRWAHAALDALGAMLDGGLMPDSIEHIAVHTFGRALTLSNEAAPAHSEAAQYSVPFVLALRALRGRAALLPLRDGSLADREVIRLAERVTLHVDPGFDAMFPSRVPARLVVDAGGRRWENTVLDPWGEPSNPMEWDALVEKLRVATWDRIDDPARERFLRAAAALRLGETGTLREVLRHSCRAATPDDLHARRGSTTALSGSEVARAR
jgi:2-methylcitrate dehydratase PrpD